MLCIMPQNNIRRLAQKTGGRCEIGPKTGDELNWNRWKMRRENSYKYSWKLGGWLQKPVGDDGKMAIKTCDVQEVDSLN